MTSHKQKINWVLGYTEVICEGKNPRPADRLYETRQCFI